MPPLEVEDSLRDGRIAGLPLAECTGEQIGRYRPDALTSDIPLRMLNTCVLPVNGRGACSSLIRASNQFINRGDQFIDQFDLSLCSSIQSTKLIFVSPQRDLGNKSAQRLGFAPMPPKAGSGADFTKPHGPYLIKK
jgi:hypothetical protein